MAVKLPGKSRKRMKPLCVEAEELGFVITQRRNNHLKLRLPGHRTIFAPCTPSDHRGILNCIAQIRRCAEGRCQCHG